MSADSDVLRPLTSALAARFRLERELGRGGMAIVYLAEDLRHDRRVAIKVLRPEIGAALGADRFLREIKLTAKLQHPHILPLLDSGEAAGLLYYVMPYVEGESLRQRLQREKQLPVDDALRIVKEVADALDFAHQRDIVHRDIKPENILLEGQHAVVSDFGIARACSPASGERLTEPGVAIGTAEYMSPEQAAGERDVDHRSDVYSLACVLYEMLAGQPPFTGATPESILHQHLAADPPALTAIRPAVPSGIAAVVQRALSKSAADRYPSVGALADTLSSAVRGGALHLAGAPQKSIAVLPFVNMSPDPENEYFSDGMTEEIINALTQLKDLRVAARTSCFAFKGKSPEITEVGAKLRVGTVLEGSVRRAGNRLRVTAQLVDVTNGYHLWSERFDRAMEDVFAVQDEITRAIVSTLKVKLIGDQAPAVRPGTRDVDAYTLYLKGRYFWNKRTIDDFTRGIEHFSQAIAVDERYALAYAGLADSYSLLGWYRHLPAKEAYAKTTWAAEHAVEIDDTLAEAYTSLAYARFLYDWDWEGAERDFKRAIERNSCYPTAHHWYGEFLMAMGRLDEALEEVRFAHALDPLSLSIGTGVGWALYFRGEYDEAIEQYHNVRSLEPNFVILPWFLGPAYVQAGRYDDAIALYERWTAPPRGHPGLRAFLTHACAVADRRDRARKLCAKLERQARQEAVPPDYMALAYTGLGDIERAFQWLERAFAERCWSLAFLKVEPLYQRLRGDERFQSLRRRIGLT